MSFVANALSAVNGKRENFSKGDLHCNCINSGNKSGYFCTDEKHKLHFHKPGLSEITDHITTVTFGGRIVKCNTTGARTLVLDNVKACRSCFSFLAFVYLSLNCPDFACRYLASKVKKLLPEERLLTDDVFCIPLSLQGWKPSSRGTPEVAHFVFNKHDCWLVLKGEASLSSRHAKSRSDLRFIRFCDSPLKLLKLSPVSMNTRSKKRTLCEKEKSDATSSPKKMATPSNLAAHPITPDGQSEAGLTMPSSQDLADLEYPISPISFPIFHDIEEGELPPSVDDVASSSGPALTYHHQLQNEQDQEMFQFGLI